MMTRIKVFGLILFLISVLVIFAVSKNVFKKFNQRLSVKEGERSLKEEEQIDWHDWKLIEKDSLRSGLGEHGMPAYLPFYPPYSKEINDTVGYNGYLSDKIALNRSLKDLRPTA